jgi:exonuclease VII large subunit
MVAHTTCKTPTAVATRLVEMADYEMNIIDNHANSIAGLIEERLHNEDMRIYTLSNNIERHATSIITEQLNRMDQIKRAISGRLELIFASEEQRLTAAERSLKSYSIDNILRLGFAVARNQDGALKSVNDADIGNAIDIELIDGVIGAEIKSITPKN